MHAVVRSYRTFVVEGRFISFIAAAGVIVMRATLFFRGGRIPVDYNDTGYLWRYFTPLFADPVLSLLASTISVFLIASLISSLNSRFTLIRSRSTLPFVIPLFLLSLHPWFLAMTADYVAVIFILMAFFPLLQSYQTSDASLYSFRSAILIGVASLFQIYAIVLLPLWWRGELSMRGTQFRSFLSSLFGFCLVYVSLFSLYFLFDDLPGFVRPFLSFASFSLPQLPDYSWSSWGIVVLIAIFFISSMILSIRTYTRDKVLTLIFMQFMVLLITFSLLLQILYWQETLFFLMLSIAFISYLNAYFYTRTQSPAYIWLALLIVVIAFCSYLYHLFPE